MAVKKIQLSDVAKKDLRIVSYLLASAIIAFGLSLLADKPEIIYLTPIVNFVLYRVTEELKKEGYVKAIKG